MQLREITTFFLVFHLIFSRQAGGIELNEINNSNQLCYFFQPILKMAPKLNPLMVSSWILHLK